MIVKIMIDCDAALRNEIGPEHYRYSERHNEEGVGIYLERFVVVRETPECWWVCKASLAHQLRWCSFADGRKRKVIKRVCKTAGVKHCWPTLSDAWSSYGIRKRYELRRLQDRLEVINQAMSAMPEAPPSDSIERIAATGFARVLDCGTPPCHDSYSWE